MRTQLLTLLTCCLLAACSGLLNSVPPAFTGKAVSDLPVRIRSYNYPTYRKGIQYKATAYYRYDAHNRLIRIDSTGYGQSIGYQYTDNRLSERQTYQNGMTSTRTQFLYNGKGQLDKAIYTNGQSSTETTYQFDNSGQLAERKTVYQSSPNDAFISRFTWRNGNMVMRVEMDGTGQKRSEWSYSYDQQPNYKALLTVNPDPDQPRTYNNQISIHLERDYTGLIDLCTNPYGSRYKYRPDGLAESWEMNSCSLYYNEIEYEAKQ